MKKPKTPSTIRPLTNKQKLFVEYYLESWNASEAARRAGYSERTAAVIGHENLRKPNIRARIEERLGEAAMGANEVLKRLSDQARGSVEPFVRVTPEGFVYFDFSNPEARRNLHLIKKVKTKRSRKLTGSGEDTELWEDEWFEVELYDAQKALESLGRHHILFTDKRETVGGEEHVKVNVYLPDNQRGDRIEDVSDSD